MFINTALCLGLNLRIQLSYAVVLLTDSRKRNWEKDLQKAMKENQHFLIFESWNWAWENLSFFMFIIKGLFFHLFNKCFLRVSFVPDIALPVGENTVSKMAVTVPRSRGSGPHGACDLVGETYINKIYCNEKCESNNWGVSRKR